MVVFILSNDCNSDSAPSDNEINLHSSLNNKKNIVLLKDFAVFLALFSFFNYVLHKYRIFSFLQVLFKAGMLYGAEI